VAPSSVVVLEPGCKRCGAVCVGEEDVPVGPFGLQGAVEAFDLAVLPGAVRLDELLPDPVRGADLAQREPVGPGVVGDEPLDAGDAVGGEVGDRAFQERRAGGSLLVGQDLLVREPGVIVDE
jgi:hypothetical protein